MGLVIVAAATFAASPSIAADRDGWDQASSIGRDALGIVALGLPAIEGDKAGVMQAGGSLGAAYLVTRGFKETFPERRPDGSDNKSFPSGHTSSAFAAAATIHNRYGWRAGLPAHLVATFVGVSRVQARKHHWYDVVAGAAVGEASGFLITSARNSNVRMLPWGDTKGGGVAVALRF